MSNEVKNRIIKTELVDISKLTPFQGKLKTLDDKNFNKLRKSIIDEGFSFTVHVWENGGVTYIIDGHQRVSVLTQMRKQGIEVPPISCSFVSAKTYRDAKKLVLLAVSQYGKIQKDGFLEFVDGEDFDFEDYDFPDLTFDLEGLFDAKNESAFDESKEDEVPDDAPARVLSGEIWQLGDHKFICGDSSSPEVIKMLMGSEKAELVFCDPPYRMNMGKKESDDESLVTKASRKLGNKIAHLIDFDPIKFLECLPSVFNQKIMNSYIFCNKDLVPDYLNWGLKNDYAFNILFWKKPNSIPIGGTHRPDVEYLLHFRKSAIWNNGLEDVSYSKCLEFGRDNSTAHPTMKPVGLITNELMISSNKGGIVVDFFLGSGSTIVGAEKTGRRCYGFEIDPKYCDIIITRWENLTGKKVERISSGR